MHSRGWIQIRACGATCLVCFALAACRSDAPQTGPVMQTNAPGHVSAGGATSGEVVARSEQAKGGGKDSPEGTPGIPQGSGGNTGGTAMGGTSEERGEEAQAGETAEKDT